MSERHDEIILPAGEEIRESEAAREVLGDLVAVAQVVSGRPPDEDPPTRGVDERIVRGRIRALLAIGQGLHGEGGFDSADQLFDRAVALAEERYGSSDPIVADALRDRAGVLMRDGRAAEASTLYRRALIVLQATLDADHPDIATTLHDLALSCEAAGRGEEAKLLWAEARRALRGRVTTR